MQALAQYNEDGAPKLRLYVRAFSNHSERWVISAKVSAGHERWH